MKRLFSFVVMCVGLFVNQVIAQPHNIQSIVELLNQGEIMAAKTLLQANVQENQTDIDSRLLLGTVSDFLGEPDDAIRIWSAGLSDTDDDYALYMSIGELRLRQGMQGSSFRYVKGVLQPLDEIDSLEDNRFKTQQLNLAVVAFQKAANYYPYESDAWENLAASYQELNQFEIDESALTGESMSVTKKVATLGNGADLGEQFNMVFKGTAVVKGNAKALITGTGLHTELGKISSMVETAEQVVTPLEKKLQG